jgi:hypothetical protein
MISRGAFDKETLEALGWMSIVYAGVEEFCEFPASVRRAIGPCLNQGSWPRNRRIPTLTLRSTLACPAGVGIR